MQGGLAEDITLQRLSDVFHLNSNYISKWFKEKSIAIIAEAVGFKDYRVFTKVFKEWEGVSPSIYRKSWKETL